MRWVWKAVWRMPTVSNVYINTTMHIHQLKNSIFYFLFHSFPRIWKCPDGNGRRALDYVATIDAVAIGKMLLDNGADPNLDDANGRCVGRRNNTNFRYSLSFSLSHTLSLSLSRSLSLLLDLWILDTYCYVVIIQPILPSKATAALGCLSQQGQNFQTVGGKGRRLESGGLPRAWPAPPLLQNQRHAML